jgi:hypothetical protein
MAHQLKALAADQVLDIALGAGEKVVDADDVGAGRIEPVAQVGAEKTRPAGYQDSLLKMHVHPDDSRVVNRASPSRSATRRACPDPRAGRSR